MMYSPQKLHPISYITGIIDVIKQNIFLVIIFVFFQMKDFDFTKLSNYIAPAIVTFFFLIGFVKRVIEVFKTRYWIEDNHFIVTSGLFNYERKELNIRRIQSIDTTQNLVHQIVGGVRLIIKTPSDGIDLETVTKEQSERIRLELERLKSELLNANEINQKEESEQTEEPGSMTYSEPQNETIYELSTRNLLLMAMTSGAIFVALLTIGPLFGSINEVIPWDIIGHRLGSLFQTAINTTIFVVITILIISYIVGVLINFIRYFGYTLRRKGELLNIRYGLLSVRHVTVPISKIQAVVEEQSFIQRLFGYTSFKFIITSDMETDIEDESVSGHVMVLPFIKRNEAITILRKLVPTMLFTGVEKGLPWRGFHRRFWIQSIALIIIGGVVYYYLAKWVWIPITFIIIVFMIHSLLAVLKSGMNVLEEEVIVRKVKLFSFETSYINRDKVLGFKQMSHPLMKRAALAHFDFVIASGATHDKIGLKFVNLNNVKHYHEWYIGGDYQDEENES